MNHNFGKTWICSVAHRSPSRSQTQSQSCIRTKLDDGETICLPLARFRAIGFQRRGVSPNEMKRVCIESVKDGGVSTEPGWRI